MYIVFSPTPPLLPLLLPFPLPLLPPSFPQKIAGDPGGKEAPCGKILAFETGGRGHELSVQQSDSSGTVRRPCSRPMSACWMSSLLSYPHLLAARQPPWPAARGPQLSRWHVSRVHLLNSVARLQTQEEGKARG